MELREFLTNSSYQPTTIKNIVTASKHKKIILDTLNSIMREYPEWETTLLSLAEYTKQKWALNQKISEENYIDIFKHNESSFEMVEKYKFTTEVIELIDTAITDEYFKLSTFSNKNEFDAFEAAHDLSADDESKHMMSTYYRKAIERFCEAHNDKIHELLEEVKCEYDKMSAEEALVYHDTEMLLKTLRYIIKKKKYLKNIDEELLIELIKICINKIKLFPFDGETMAKIMNLYIFENMSDKKISLNICSSETFVRSKRAQATELISLLLFGYSARMILKTM